MSYRFSPDLGQLNLKDEGGQREASALHDEVCFSACLAKPSSVLNPNFSLDFLNHLSNVCGDYSLLYVLSGVELSE